MERSLKTDCLIIGSGIAGLSAAVALGEQGIDTLVITCAPSTEESNSLHAQGGIIYEAHPEDGQDLISDIMEAGAGQNYYPAVEQLAKLGPELVKKILIDRAQTDFDKGSSGWHLTREGAHSESRILHRGDESGRAIQLSLLKYCRRLPSVQFLSDTTAVNLLMSSFHSRSPIERHRKARCFGAFVFDQKDQQVYPIYAHHTVIATGGIGQLYLHHTNSRFARGDGIALAHRSGCRLASLEYIQFHPTTFFHRASRRFLISEALRGEGAILINHHGERFMRKYLPEVKHPELAPRDRVAWAIHQEMLSTGAECVYLDISHKPADWIAERFPFVYRSCLRFRVDITRQPIPVVPGSHYHCGGIWTDLEGRTSVPRIWAVGEVACTGLHGANRLASTSLLEGLVWGTQSGDSIAKQLHLDARIPFPEIEQWRPGNIEVDPAFLSQDWLTLKHTMWNYVGLIKTDARLARAQGILTELARGIDNFYRQAKLSDSLIGLRHASLVALLILEASKRNRRSVGCYQREELEI